MSEPPHALRDLVLLAQQRHADIRGRPASLRALERAAREAGYEVGNSTLSRISTGTYPSDLGEDLLRALSHLSGVPYREVHRIAGRGNVRPPFADQLPRNVDLLTPREREVLVRLMSVMLAGRRPGDVADDERALPSKPTPGAAHFHDPDEEEGTA